MIMNLDVVNRPIYDMINKYMTKQGFYIEKDKQILLVSKINTAGNRERLYMDYQQYSIAFLNPPEGAIPQEGALFPEDDYPVEVGLEVYFSQCFDGEGELNSVTSHVSDVQAAQGETLFSIEPAPPQTQLPYPVFAKVRDVVQLMGIFSPVLNTFVHIQAFDEETRKRQIAVENGNFKGFEGGNRGGGPRSIRIIGEGIDRTYSLKYCMGDKRVQPHHDDDYNKGQTRLYQAALNRFVELYNNLDNQDRIIPENFYFDCYTNSRYFAE